MEASTYGCGVRRTRVLIWLFALLTVVQPQESPLKHAGSGKSVGDSLQGELPTARTGEAQSISQNSATKQAHQEKVIPQTDLLSEQKEASRNRLGEVEEEVGKVDDAEGEVKDGINIQKVGDEEGAGVTMETPPPQTKPQHNLDQLNTAPLQDQLQNLPEPPENTQIKPPQEREHLPECVNCEDAVKEVVPPVVDTDTQEVGTEHAPKDPLQAEQPPGTDQSSSAPVDKETPSQEHVPQEQETGSRPGHDPIKVVASPSATQESEKIPAVMEEDSTEEDIGGGRAFEVDLGTPGGAPEVKEEIEPPKEKQKMPSFDEWKEQMLAEQAEQEKTKQLEAAQLNQNGGQSGSKKPSPKQSRVNYAAVSCGAKVLNTNTEAQNRGSILTENKDQYMIQPCKAKKWFVVELCEPIQLQSLEIANLELFSSLPESFIVLTSDRYPTKDWKPLGTFHARDERSIQSFSVADEDMFAKYVKIEMLSHYGNEHYCPLSIIRVYGRTVEEDEEEPETVVTSEEDFDGELLPPEDSSGEHTNLFTSATDTVMSIVKTVLSPGEKEAQQEDPGIGEMEGMIKLNGTAVNQSVINTTVPSNTETQKVEPCTPSADSGPPGGSSSGPPGGSGAAPGERGAPLPHTPNVDTSINLPDSDSPADRPATPVPSTAEEMRMVTLIESPSKFSPLRDVFKHCDFCTRADSNLSYFDTQSSCGYYKLKYVYPICCKEKKNKIVVSPNKEQIPVFSETIGSNIGEKKEDRVTSGGRKVEGLSENEENGEITQERKEESVQPTQKSESTATPDNVVKPSEETTAGDKTEGQPHASLKPSPTLKVESATKPSDVVLLSSSDDVKSESETTPPLSPESRTQRSESSDEVVVSASSAECETSACTLGPEAIRPTHTEEVVSTSVPTIITPSTPTETTHPPKQPDKSAATETAQPDQADKPASKIPATPTHSQAEEPPSNGNGMKNIYAEAHSDHDDLDLETVAPPDGDEPVQKLSSGKKQTTYMTLKNRMKALELNLNLSSRYLEELSQRYRREMEEMYTSLNKTIARLANTSKSAAMRDVAQQDRIILLERKLDNLTSVMLTASENMAGLNRQVIERHLFLMMLEATIFALVLAWCLNRQQKQVSLQRPASSFTTPLKNANTHANKDLPPGGVTATYQRLKRRNSIDATPPRKRVTEVETSPRRSQDDIGLRWSGSEGSFNIVQPDLSIFIKENPSNVELNVPKKKKKKKGHQKKPSLGATQSLGNLTGRGNKENGTASCSSSGSHPSNTSITPNTSSSKLSLAELFCSNNHQREQRSSSFSSASNSAAVSSSSSENHFDPTGAAGRVKKSYTARRSLDLDTAKMNGQSHGSSNGKNVKRSGSVGNGLNGRVQVSNIGYTDYNTGVISKSEAHQPRSNTHINGNSLHTKSDATGSWKYWFPGIRK